LEFLYEYGLFFAKAITFVIAIGIIIGLIVSASSKSTSSAPGAIKVTPLNQYYEDVSESLKEAIYEEEYLKNEQKLKKKQEKASRKEKKAKVQPQNSKNTSHEKKRLFLLDFDGDIKASAVDSLREEVTAILTLASEHDEVVIRLESAGGMVHSYGLAASQLSRIKEKGVPLTICVDKVAASGGYMMACVAHTICAAPFAIIGSIGVVAQLPNFHRILKKNDIDFELLTAGEYKRTLTMFGENTEKGREKFVEDLDTTHSLFKDFVRQQRPIVDIDKAATGEVWFGSEAKDRLMVDKVMTSDDYIMSQLSECDAYHISYSIKKTLPERLGVNIQKATEGAFTRLLGVINTSRFMMH